MKGIFQHCNINVSNLKQSIAFYENALGLQVMDEKIAEDGSFHLVYLGDGTTPFTLELTWLKDHPQPYELGENESHICFCVEHMKQAYEHHKAMDCICFENKAMGLYFIHDPDDYWLEIVEKR